jgi:hypothetical protein
VIQNKTIKLALASAIVIATSIGSGYIAQAVTTDTNFATIVNKYQQSHYWEYQMKERAGVSAVQFDFIGSTYTMNVKAQNGSTGAQYSERTGISESATPSTIANNTPVGTSTRLIVTNNAWVTVDVLTTGHFRTN